MIVSDLLKEQANIRHGFFTRQGGVSTGIYDSLNCGYGSGDKTESVRENRKRVAGKLGIAHGNVLTVRQVHSSRAVVADSNWSQDSLPEADAIVTAEPDVAIGVLTADCTPVLFCDSAAAVIGAAHAGWRGAKGGVIEAVIAEMESLGASRERICATIGPAISRAAYEVGEDFQGNFLAEDESNADFFSQSDNNSRPHFDLPGYCQKRLALAGIVSVERMELCTYTDDSLFYSYRRSIHQGEADYGRQISAIVIL
ncbi:MAG: peptidoglycan editing factor PgeF [Hyphomicrobiales bacterium]|nr:peptidoglycan editing factor PgeF [Hyphomicrobiales bacterium]